MLIDLSWVVYPSYVLRDLDRWAALIHKYPQNFVIGSDSVGSFGDYTDQIRIYGPLFDALADPILIERLASRNFLQISRKVGVTLDPNYHYPENRYTRRPLVPR